MKPLWTPTLAWLAASAVALLLALCSPEDGVPPWHHVDLPNGTLLR